MDSADMARKRWKGIPQEERSEMMRAIASLPRPKAKGKPKPRRKTAVNVQLPDAPSEDSK